jgi:hypothetical protein
MQSTPPRRQNGIRALVALSVLLAIVAASLAGAAKAVRPDDGPVAGRLRMLTDHYRRVTWEYERAAHVKRTPTSFSYRHTSSRAYLAWTVESWTKRSYLAQREALSAIHRRLAVKLPQPPALRAPLSRRVTYNRRLALSLRRIYPGRVTRSFASASAGSDHATLRLWQERSAAAAIAVAEHAVRRAEIASGLEQALMCIHSFEGAWNSNTGNGYYGGLQMDWQFMSLYGSEFVARWGTADNWPVWAQLEAAARAHESGRGFTPWPNTARACGLL